MSRRPLSHIISTATTWSRRQLLAGTATVAAQAMLPRAGRAAVPTRESSRDGGGARMDPTLVKQLTLRAIDAARSAGAQYADVRVTRTLVQSVHPDDPVASDQEALAVGVRCLVNGAWGFAATPFVTPDDVVAVAQRATATARAYANQQLPPVELGSGSTAAVSGDWTMPVVVDPFTVPLEEKRDFLRTLRSYSRNYRLRGGTGEIAGTVVCYRQERAVATTDGTYVTQTVYRTTTDLALRYRGRTGPLVIPVRGLMPGGRGWELFRDARILDQQSALYDEADELAATPTQQGVIGQYDLVCDAATMAALVAQTLGTATDLDRALGEDANATGTSYLGPDPLSLLGQAKVGAASLTLTADRSLPGGLATVMWDDEGVVPETATLVRVGVLTDYQTTREQANWLAPYYQKAGRPVRSHGHAAAESALSVTMQQRPNLALTPGAQPLALADLVAGTKRGLVISDGVVSTNVQARTGAMRGRTIRRIVNGQLGEVVVDAELLVDAPALWAKLAAVGGTASLQIQDYIGAVDPRIEGRGRDVKGDPAQAMAYSVAAVPAVLQQVSCVPAT